MFANFILPELNHKCSEVFGFEISENKAIIRLQVVKLKRT